MLPPARLKAMELLVMLQFRTTPVPMKQLFRPTGVPQVDAGSDLEIINPVNSVDLDATVSGGTTLWTKQSGPGNVTFGNASAVDTTATFSAYGTYVLRLTATQSGKTGYDEVTVNYYQTAPPQNQAPVVNAGSDQQITLPSGATLDGTVSDDGLPNPPAAVTTLWSQQSGPGTVIFDNSAAVDTTASFSEAGTYVLRLTADDSSLSNYDELTVQVAGDPNNPPPPPIADWYRIGLHFHTTNSDGSEEPNTMFTQYKVMGENGLYDGVLVTDHDYATDGSPWTTSTYLGITGVEVTNGKSHVNAFGWTGPTGIVSTPGSTLQEHINTAVSNGALAIVNHPKWTMEYSDQSVTNLPEQIINSTNCKLFEIFNHYCEDYWGWGFSESIYDQVLTAGKLMYCVAGDDAHGLGRAGFTSVYVGAQELTVDALKIAMNNGHFYACRSTDKWHPGIKLTSYQVSGIDVDDTISITADSAATKIEFIGKNGSILKTVNSNSGSYTIAGTEKYVRARITNTAGDYTWTQPVFVAGGSTPPEPGPIDDYEGYDDVTTGGNGGTEILVTNLNDSGAGSLRWALSQCDGVTPRMIKFQVGGCIGLISELEARSYVTVAGETAPSPGITLVSSGAYRAFSIDNMHFILRHIRIRSFDGEGIQIWGGHHIVVDRCSFSGMGDGTLDLNSGHHHVVSRCIFAGNMEVHKTYGTETSFHHNLYAWNNRRQPRCYHAGPIWDFRNNLVEYWTNTGANILNSTGVNLINNFWGPPAPLEAWNVAVIISGTTDPATIYTHGNYCSGFNVDGVGAKSTPNTEPNVTTIAAVDVPANVHADSGAQPWDAIDQYYLGGGGLNPPAPPAPGDGGGEPNDPNDPNEPTGLAWNIIDADYYVDATTGSDSNPGTIDAPFQTIGKAKTVALAGNKVVVWGDGQTYTGALTFTTSGTAVAPIIFMVDPGSGTATINGGGATNGTIYSTAADYIVLDGFTLTNGKYGVYLYGDGVDNWTIKNCRITGVTQHGIYIRSGDNHTLLNNIIYNTGNTYYGIYILNSALNIDVTQCDLYKGKYGIFYSTNCTGDVKDCIITNAVTNGIKAGTSTITITYSDVWNSGTNYSGCSAGTGCISANPLWAAPATGDFTLGTGSPCIGTASDGKNMGFRPPSAEPPTNNIAPEVDAGEGQSIQLPASATLDATVTDDGLPNPPAAVTVTWTKQSGPGTVTFGNANAVDTTASFSAPGTYMLRLTASDSVLESYDEIIVTVSASGPTWSETANYYVDGFTGSDSNPGSSSQPWATLTKAVSTATSGQKVLVWGGQTYTAALTFNNSGTSSAPITFKRDPATGTATINGNGGTNGTLYTTTADYIIMDGFTLTNGKYGLYAYGDGADAWTIKNCRVTGNTQHGIYIRAGDNYSIFNNCVYGNGTTSYGIYVFSTALNNDITQCAVYKHKYGIFYSSSCTSGDVKDSIVTNATTYGIYCATSSTATITYSDVWNNPTNYMGCSAGTGCISSNPLWTNPDSGDFHLGSGSPCDNTGSDGGDMGYRYSTSAL